MARGFSEQEKTYIRHSLIEKGKILFSKFGFQKTTIQDITKQVGIAQGSFYKFFQSKEELYFVILEMEEEKIKAKLAQLPLSEDVHPKETLKNTLKLMVKEVEENPLIRDLLFGDHLQRLVANLPADMLEEHFQNDGDAITLLVEHWETSGIVFNEKPELIAGMFRALFLLTTHRQEIGITIYEETLERLIDYIVDGLIT